SAPPHRGHKSHQGNHHPHHPSPPGAERLRYPRRIRTRLRLQSRRGAFEHCRSRGPSDHRSILPGFGRRIGEWHGGSQGVELRRALADREASTQSERSRAMIAILLESSLRILMVVAVLFLLLWALRIRAAAIKHWVWMAATFLMLMMPLLTALGL